MQLNNKAYNAIKWAITVFLPAIGAFYFALSQVWHFPQITGVNGTINAIITFGGLLIGYSTKQYNKTGQGAPDGDLIVQADPVDGAKYLGLSVTQSALDAMTDKTTVTLNVVDKSANPPVPGVPVVNPANATSPTPVHPAHEQEPPPAMPTQS